MGVGVPVLLVIADVSTSKCYFVGLNDYIDKMLIPIVSKSMIFGMTWKCGKLLDILETH